MSQICIPRPGTELVLAKDWTFNVYLESRNSAFIRAMDIKVDGKLPQYGADTHPITLPAGTKVTLQDYSFRKGGFMLDSRIVFQIHIDERSFTVWVHPRDANSIEAV